MASTQDEFDENIFAFSSLDEMRMDLDLARSADDWFEPVEKLWDKYRKSENLSFWERLNFQQGVVGQSPAPGYLVLYGSTGSNLSAVMVDTHNLPIINGASPRAFIVDTKTYWYRCQTKEEAHYLVALLNAPCVDNAIKAHQTRGIYVGPRDIHRRPFEVCPIPQFNSNNVDHQRLAMLSEAAHKVIAGLDLSQGGVVTIRKQARLAASSYIQEIDKIAQLLLGFSSNILLEDAEEEEGQEAIETAD